jgi:prepilin peptidase CpaA
LSIQPGASVLALAGGTALGFALFLPFYLLRGMAAGDVKLMAVVGAFAGPEKAFSIAVLAWCAGGVMALLVVLAQRRLGVALGNLMNMLRTAMTPGIAMVVPQGQASAGSLPYGAAIAAGTILVLVRDYA